MQGHVALVEGSSTKRGHIGDEDTITQSEQIRLDMLHSRHLGPGANLSTEKTQERHSVEGAVERIVHAQTELHQLVGEPLSKGKGGPQWIHSRLESMKHDELAHHDQETGREKIANTGLINN